MMRDENDGTTFKKRTLEAVLVLESERQSTSAMCRSEQKGRAAHNVGGGVSIDCTQDVIKEER